MATVVSRQAHDLVVPCQVVRRGVVVSVLAVTGRTLTTTHGTFSINPTAYVDVVVPDLGDAIVALARVFDLECLS